MPVEWFDKDDTKSGVLTSSLNSDSSNIHQYIATYVVLVYQILIIVVSAITVALIFEWRTALTSIALLPLILIAGATRSAFMATGQLNSDIAYKTSSHLVNESILYIRTSKSLNAQEVLVRHFSEMLRGPS